MCFMLQGSKEQVLLARCVLENLVTECEPVTEALEVPQTAFGRIIGNCREICVTLELMCCLRASLFLISCRSWRREFKTDHQDHRG